MNKETILMMREKLEKISEELTRLADELEEFMDEDETMNGCYDAIQDAIVCVEDAGGGLEEVVDGMR